MKHLEVTEFTFTFAGYGHYKVKYTSPKTGKSWTFTTNDMELIDKTKNSDNHRTTDLTILKTQCKKYGTCKH